MKKKKKKKKKKRGQKGSLSSLQTDPEAVNLQLTSRCLKSRLEQLKIHFQRKPSSG